MKKITGRPVSSLRLARLVRGLRLLEVARETGISAARLSLAERGEIKLPERDHRKLETLYGENLTTA